MNKLYHKDVYFTNGFCKITEEMIKSRNIYYSLHVKNRIAEKGIDEGLLSSILSGLRLGYNKYELIEVETDIYVEKVLIRTKYDKNNDMLLVLRNCYCKEIGLPYLRLITCWLNENTDKHYTLDIDKYERG